VVRRQSCIAKAYCAVAIFHWKGFMTIDQSAKPAKLFHCEPFAIYGIYYTTIRLLKLETIYSFIAFSSIYWTKFTKFWVIIQNNTMAHGIVMTVASLTMTVASLTK